MEGEALKYVRDEMGLTNVKVMIPFVRTVAERAAWWPSPMLDQLLDHRGASGRMRAGADGGVGLCSRTADGPLSC
jgi:hypothetical protein